MAALAAASAAATASAAWAAAAAAAAPWVRALPLPAAGLDGDFAVADLRVAGDLALVGAGAGAGAGTGAGAGSGNTVDMASIWPFGPNRKKGGM